MTRGSDGRRTGPRSTPALSALTAADVPFVAHPYSHEEGVSSYGLEAAAALGAAPERVFKTLMASVDGTLVAAVVPVSGPLDLKALAKALGVGPLDLMENGEEPPAEEPPARPKGRKPKK